MSIYILLGIIIFSGYLAGFEKIKRFYLAKSVAIVFSETIIGVILFFIFMEITTKTFLRKMLISELSSFFVLILLIAVVDGFIIYWINRIIFPKIGISNQIQTLCEYIIQWTLIYVTVYQIIFDNITSAISSISLEKLSVTNPTDLVILILPSLISVWISIILFKIKQDSI